MVAVLPPTFDWVPPKWRGLAVAVREFCAGMPLVRIDGAFVGCQHVIRLEDLDRQAALKRALQSDRRARAHIWLERINWRSGAPVELFDALARLLRDATDLGFYGQNWPLERGLATIEDELNRVELRLARSPWRVECYQGADLSVPADAVGIALQLRRVDVQLGGLRDPGSLLRWTEQLVTAVARYALGRLQLPVGPDEPLGRLVERVQEALADRAVPDALRDLSAGGAGYAAKLGALRHEIESGPRDGDWVHTGHARFAADFAVGWAKFVYGVVSDLEPAAATRSATVVPLPRPRRAPNAERLAAR